LGPIDPQIVGQPAASIVRARDSKPIEQVFDLTFVLADVSEKALAQVKREAVELMTPRLDQAKAEGSSGQTRGRTLDPRLRIDRGKGRQARVASDGRHAARGDGAHESVSTASAALGRRVFAHRCARQASGVVSALRTPGNDDGCRQSMARGPSVGSRNWGVYVAKHP
jgi:hypothetical protein